MTTPPAQMIDRWHNRAEPAPGQSTLYWHMLMNDHQQVIDLARDTQQRLARFPGLHMTPLERLHMTTLEAGPSDHFSQDQLRQMIKVASAMLADTPAITVTVGGIVYHPEAIMLDVKPKRVLAGVHDAVRAATRAVSGGHDPDGTPPRWIPHVTVCYSTAQQAMAPIVAALGPGRRECQIQIGTVSLVIQHGPERLWDWRTAGTVHLAEPAGTQAGRIPKPPCEGRVFVCAARPLTFAVGWCCCCHGCCQGTDGLTRRPPMPGSGTIRHRAGL